MFVLEYLGGVGGQAGVFELVSERGSRGGAEGQDEGLGERNREG